MVGHRALGRDLRQRRQLALGHIELIEVSSPAVLGDKTTRAQSLDALFDNANNKIYILFSMRRGQKIIAPLPNEDTLLHHVVKEQFEVLSKREAEQRTKIDHFDGHFLRAKIRV